jgi:hypothetical protein
MVRKPSSLFLQVGYIAQPIHRGEYVLRGQLSVTYYTPKDTLPKSKRAYRQGLRKKTAR